MNSNALLRHNVLVLNKSWQPINVTPVFKALKKVVAGKAKIVRHDFSLHDFESWVDNWSDITSISKDQKQRFIGNSSICFMIPEIIIFTRVKIFRPMNVKFSRKSVFLRDNNTCQYCGKQLLYNKLNIDHVLPRSQGGKSTWKNVVVSCIPCNSVKGDRTPIQAGMILIKNPVRPQYVQNKTRGEEIPKSWEQFIDIAYWNIKLDE